MNARGYPKKPQPNKKTTVHLHRTDIDPDVSMVETHAVMLFSTRCVHAIQKICTALVNTGEKSIATNPVAASVQPICQ